jgi:hypothetical protein
LTANLLAEQWLDEKADGFVSLAAEHIRSALYFSPSGISSGVLSSRVRNLAACVAPHLSGVDETGDSKLARTILKDLVFRLVNSATSLDLA